MAKFKLVTAIAVNRDGESEAASTYVAEGESLEKVIEDIKQGARERFYEEAEFTELAHFIVHVDDIELPDVPTTVLQALPTLHAGDPAVIESN